MIGIQWYRPGSAVLLFSLCFSISALDKVTVLSEKELDNASAIALGTFTPAQNAENVPDQSRYLQQLRETLLYGLRSAGYTTTDGIDSTRLPDLVLEVAFTEVDNKGMGMRLTISMLLKSIRSGNTVLEILNRQSAFDSDLKDEMRNLTDEQGMALLSYFRERKKKNAAPVAPAAPLTCNELSSSRLVFCTLHSPEIRVTANIIGVELQKWTQKRKIPLRKIDYSLDTAYQRIYAEKQTDATIDALPGPIQSSLAGAGIDYCLLLYDFRDRAPGGERTDKKISLRVSYNNIAFGPSSRGDRLGKANQFNSIYCRFSLIAVKENRALVTDDFWADKEECDDEVVQCIVERVKDALSETDGKSGKLKRCWR